MSEDHEESPSQRLRNGGTGKSYLGEKGESVFIRTSGKGDFKIVNLINRSTFALADIFFTSEKEARLFAAKRHLTIVDYTEDAGPAPPD